MRRIGKLLGGLVTGRDVGGRPARAGSRRRQVAGSRPGLRADRQGGRDARRAGQAARHRRPRRGQAGLRPRDDQAARPGEEIEKILDPEATPARPPPGWPVEKWGPVGAFLGWTIDPEFWDDQPFILVDYLPLRRRIVADTLATRLKAIADKSTTPDDEKATLREAGRRRRSRPPPALDVVPPRLQAAARRPEDHRRAGRQAERGTQVAHPARARGGPDHRQGSDALRSSTGPASSRSSSGNSTPIPNRPPGSPRSSGGRSRSPCGSRPTRRTAASGSRPPA